MSGKPIVLIFGATGYVGGTTLLALLKSKDAENFTFKALVRNVDKARKIRSLLDIETVVGSLTDANFVESLVAEADYVFQIADSDDLEVTKAILRGLKKHKEQTGKTPYLYHTSGTGVLNDNAFGDREDSKVYDDSNTEEIEALPESQLHRPVDKCITEASKEGYIRSYIHYPCTIFGLPNNELTRAGVQHQTSIQTPLIIRTALKRKTVGLVGEGLNVWNNVHVDDVASLFVTLWEKSRADPEGTPHGRDGHYFSVSASFNFYDLGRVIAKRLYARGLVDRSEPTPFTKEEIEKYFGGFHFLGWNARGRATRSRSIGWTPQYTNADFYKSILEEVDFIVDREVKKI